MGEGDLIMMEDLVFDVSVADEEREAERMMGKNGGVDEGT